MAHDQDRNREMPATKGVFKPAMRDGTALCHRTRRGGEQAWFTTPLTANPEVIGTEIPDTAEFPKTVQRGVHHATPDRQSRAGLVYSARRQRPQPASPLLSCCG